MSKKSKDNNQISYKLGDVVVCPDKAKTGNGKPKAGTIIQITNGDLMILDAEGHIHHCRPHEVYLAQG